MLTVAIQKDAMLFARQDHVEDAWRIVDSYLRSDFPAYPDDPYKGAK